MVRHWIVDASNVIGSRPDGWWRDRPAALARLLDEISEWRRTMGEAVTVVVDGHPSSLVPEGETGGVEVRYAHSQAADAADDVIVQIVGEGADPAQLIVVTSDRTLRRRVVDLGAGVEGAGTFRDRIAG